jgi:hypothetical protein
MERQQANLDDDDGKLLQVGKAAKSDHNNQGREGAKSLPHPCSTWPVNPMLPIVPILGRWVTTRGITGRTKTHPLLPKKTTRGARIKQ